MTGMSAAAGGLATVGVVGPRTAPPRLRPSRRPPAPAVRVDPLGVARSGPLGVPLPAEDGAEILVRLAGFHDGALLRTIFVEGRADDFADLPPQLVAGLLELQHAAHLRSRRRDWPGATDYVLEHRGVPCGLLTLDAGSCLRVLDLSLLPGWRGRRRGRTVLGAVAQRAAEQGRVLRFRLRPEDAGSSLLSDLGARVVAEGVAALEVEVPG